MKIRDIFTPDHKIDFDVVKQNVPEFNLLEKTQQPKDWHAEGNVYIHTMKVVDEMYRMLKDRCSEDEIGGENYMIMLAAALFHDIGKPSCTEFSEEKGDFTSRNHQYAGERIVRRVFYDEDWILREKLCWLVRKHMAPYYILGGKDPKNEIRRLSWGQADVDMLLSLNMCDSWGSKSEKESRDASGERLLKLCNMAESLKCLDRSCEMSRSEKFGYCTELSDETKERLDNEKFEFIVYIMVGLPGSGKDTWIKKYIPDVTMLCRDNIRTEIGIEGEKPFGTEEQENEVTRILNERLVECCKNKQDCVINNINVSKKRRKEILDLILPYNPRVVIVYVEAPTLADNVERRKNQVGKKVIKRMFNSFEFPEFCEYDTLIVNQQQ